MKRIALLLLVLSAALGTLSGGASTPSWPAATAYRTHYSFVLGDATTIYITLINQSRGEDLANSRYHYSTVMLLDGGDGFGRWVVTKTAVGNPTADQANAEFHFRLLNTGEELIIFDQQGGAAQPELRNATFCGTPIVLQDAQTTLNPPVAKTWLKTRASAQFFNGLKFVRSMAYVLPQTGLSLTKKEFAAFFGPFAMSPVPTYHLKAEHVDCAFDAGFGYPCAITESSHGNAMMYTQILPQSQQP